jgi:hypothetical protein
LALQTQQWTDQTPRPWTQLLPRRLDFRTLTQADFDAIAQELSERLDRP